MIPLFLKTCTFFQFSSFCILYTYIYYIYIFITCIDTAGLSFSLPYSIKYIPNQLLNQVWHLWWHAYCISRRERRIQHYHYSINYTYIYWYSSDIYIHAAMTSVLITFHLPSSIQALFPKPLCKSSSFF